MLMLTYSYTKQVKSSLKAFAISPKLFCNFPLLPVNRADYKISGNNCLLSWKLVILQSRNVTGENETNQTIIIKQTKTKAKQTNKTPKRQQEINSTAFGLNEDHQFLAFVKKKK